MNATVVKEDVLSVDVEVRGVVGLADYVAHLKRIPGRCGIAGSGSGALALAFAVERTWRYATALVSHGGPGRVRVEVEAHPEDGPAAVAQACRILSLDVDARGFPAVMSQDPVLARRVRAGPGLRPILFGSPWEAACWAVVCHRFRVTHADALVRRIAERRGQTLHVGGREVACFPSPGDLGELDASSGLSEAKRSRLAALADAALAGELDASTLRARPVAEALDAVRRLPGIGPFSAELVVGRGVGHPDLFPAAETHLTTALRRSYGLDGVEPVTVGDAWRPYRSWGAFFFREVPSDEQ
ncbi:DNA-3-methyladenine glycosylase family protein [Saccharomonospora azurea]|uniref:DNA-3-methyladenine glycosylase family protein n=1 Tax=Saccharomonospora azurea TaxID=40988 RepID=UPI00240A372A|nr:DNA-3-methyladenine glycosylase 2 family protein [Saccharomonospora azurea]